MDYHRAHLIISLELSKYPARCSMKYQSAPNGLNLSRAIAREFKTSNSVYYYNFTRETPDGMYNVGCSKPCFGLFLANVSSITSIL